MTTFGAGIALDEEFDLKITGTGDVATESGVSDLEKDLAVAIGDTVRELGIGGRLTRQVEQDLRIEIGDVVDSDPRVDEITSLSIRRDDDENDLLRVELTVTTAAGPFDLVIPIST